MEHLIYKHCQLLREGTGPGRARKSGAERALWCRISDREEGKGPDTSPTKGKLWHGLNAKIKLLQRGRETRNVLSAASGAIQDTAWQIVTFHPIR